MNILIITASLVQDHEFIYPFYRLQEENNKVDVALKNALPVKGILGTPIPPKVEDTNVINYEQMKIDNYDLLVLPGGAKAMEYLRQEKIVLEFIKDFDNQNKRIGCICHGAQLLISAKNKNGIVPAKPKRVCHSIAYIFFYRIIRCVI